MRDRGVRRARLDEHEDLVEHLERVDQAEHASEEDGRGQQGQDHPAKAGPSAPAVHACRVEQLRGDRLEGCQEDDHVHAEPLPDRHGDDGRHRQHWIVDPLLWREADHPEDLIEQAGVRVVDPLPDEGHGDRRRDHRQEVRGPNEGDAADLDIERHGHAEGQRQAERDRHDRVEERVAQCLEETVVGQQREIVVEASQLGRRQQIPVREADCEGRQDGSGRQHRQSDEGRGKEQQCPATLTGKRPAAAPVDAPEGGHRGNRLDRAGHCSAGSDRVARRRL